MRAHSITVYANDTEGNTGASETVYFTVVTHNEPDGTEQQETPNSQPPIRICVAAVLAVILISVIIILGIAFHRKRVMLRKSHRF